MIALLRDGSRFLAGVLISGPHKEINYVFLMVVDCDCDRSVVHIVKASAYQGIALLLQVYYWRRKVQFPIKPWFNSMLVSRDNIGQVTWHKGTNMAGEHLLG